MLSKTCDIHFLEPLFLLSLKHVNKHRQNKSECECKKYGYKLDNIWLKKACFNNMGIIINVN